jgi:hypothetical protein
MNCCLALAFYVAAKAAMRFVPHAATTILMATLRAALVARLDYPNLAILFSAVIA